MFNTYKRIFRIAAVSAFAALMGMSSAWSQTAAWPSRPIKILVGFPPGGASDVMARLIANKLGPALGGRWSSRIVRARPGHWRHR
jgi:tripartite-type tricarboxylate transporter receptor subunit TctC